MQPLFVDQSQQPLRFFLCGYSGLALQIQLYGGSVSLLNSNDCIPLVPAKPLQTLTEHVYRRPVYSYTYVQDCIEARALLPLHEYEVYCEEMRKEKPGLRQMDVNELVKFVGKHPVWEPKKQYWRWACDNVGFEATPSSLRKAYERHVKQLRKQGFAGARRLG